MCIKLKIVLKTESVSNNVTGHVTYLRSFVFGVFITLPSCCAHFLPHSSLGTWGIAIISICFAVCLSIHTFCQHSISSMHRWRKVVCYPVMLDGGGLEAYQRGVTVPIFWGVKMGENVEILWRPSTHLINTEIEKGGMLPLYATWSCLEAYKRGMTLTDFWG